MRSTKMNAVRGIVLTTLLLLPGSATADPIVITSGHLDTRMLDARFRLEFAGENFFLRAVGDGSVGALTFDCFPCAPGTILDVGGTFFVPLGSGSAVVDGVSYPEIYVDGALGTFVAPPVRLEGSGPVTLQVPFTYSGTIKGFLESAFTRPSDVLPVFSTDVVGSGQVTMTFLFNDDDTPLFFASSRRFDFESAAPVPEPATMLLCGTGVAFLAARRRRQTHNLREPSTTSRRAD